MFGAKLDNGRSRRAALSAVMLGVLLLMVGLAWLLVRAKGIPPGQSQEVLGEIRSKGLRHYWPKPRERWLLMRLNGEVVGWQASLVTPERDGSFSGVSASHSNLPNHKKLMWERWQLNADATEGEYAAGEAVTASGLPLLATDTHIAYSQGQLRVQQKIKGRTYESSAEAPADYLPKGVLPLARRVVADRESVASFHMVINDRPPSDGKTTFVALAMLYESTSASPPLKGARIVREFSYAGGGEELYFLDKNGNVIGVEIGNLSMTAATVADVARHFGGVRRIVYGLLTTPVSELSGLTKDRRLQRDPNEQSVPEELLPSE